MAPPSNKYNNMNPNATDSGGIPPENNSINNGCADRHLINESVIQTKPSPLADQIIPKQEIVSKLNISALAVDEINLYYIDSNQDWWFASQEGEIIAPAFAGNCTVVADATIPADNRTETYVWKIRIGADLKPPEMHGASTIAVNATNGEIFFKISTP